MKILKHIWDLYLINALIIYWVWTSFYGGSQHHIFLLANFLIGKGVQSISGVFGQDWKNTRVTPIYEDDGDINDKNNYRPISVIDHMANMIESLVSYQIIDFF